MKVLMVGGIKQGIQIAVVLFSCSLSKLLVQNHNELCQDLVSVLHLRKRAVLVVPVVHTGFAIA